MSKLDSGTRIFTREGGLFRGSALQFLLALIFLLFVYPVFPVLRDIEHGSWFEGVVYTIVMLSGVVAVGNSRRDLFIAITLLVLTLMTQWGWRFGHRWVSEILAYSFLLVFFLFVASLLVRFILRSERVDLDVLSAGIAGYLLLGLVWTYSYLLLNHIEPLSFSHQGEPLMDLDQTDAFYFSFVTLTTLGYGDVAPLAKQARVLAVAEAATGVLYLGVLVSRLVALFSVEARAREEKT